jgi:tetratricopeptide (TPR) repeat protein
MSKVLKPGTAIGQRFVIEGAARDGGMGTVYVGRDRETDDRVAIKLLHAAVNGFDEAERFAREVQILAELRHPGIVSYVSHGVLETGQPYLVMEWLQGEDLSQRLREGPMTPTECLLLLRRLAEALDVAHQHQIVHRDIKPSNLFLRHSDIDRITLLDFGIARRATNATAVTRTGLIIGTPEYMAPEQARGQREIGPAADIFSLGCVFYECLTGQPPFIADAMAGVMAKILFEPAPPLRLRHPGVPEPLDLLLGRMLEKEPSLRLQDAGALLAALAGLEGALGDLSSLRITRITPRQPSRTPAEQQLVSVLLSSVPSLVPDWDSEANIASPADTEPARELARALAVYGARVEVLADGSIVAMLAQRSHMTATDLAAQAARCALVLRQRFPDSFSTLTTGRALLGGRMPIGEAVERSAWIREVGLGEQSVPTSSGEVIFLDEVTAGLLESRFEMRRLQSGVHALLGEKLVIDEARSLLGRQTPCVGRDRELAMLDLLFTECRDDSTARVALILASAGMGKSRLRHEFARRLQARAELVQIYICRADPLSTASPYAMLSQAVRQMCDIVDGESPAAQQAKLRAHACKKLGDQDGQRAAEFLAELCGIPFADVDNVGLRAAREDARIMADQLQRAFTDLLRSQCYERPVLLVLEDLQWGDTPSVRLTDAALRELADQPLMVLGLGRPELETLFPRLWADRGRQEMRLEGLNRKASERLVRQVLGDERAGATVVLRIIEQSHGNPLFLEELIRAVAEGKGDELPETVLAMLQSRILRLEPGARRILRAASVYGQTFWRSGLVPLLRTEPGTIDLDRWMQRLIESELIETQRDSRYPSDPQYRFRHALLRDAAYSLLTVEYRQLCHRLVAQHLELLDDSDPLMLAEHYERGNDRVRASSLYLRAAELAHRRGDADSAIAWSRHGLACGPDEIARLGLLSLLCQAYLWRNQWSLAAELAGEVMQLSEAGSPSWAIAAAAELVDARQVHDERFIKTIAALQKVEPEPDAVSPMAYALRLGVYILDSAGEFSRAEISLQRLRDIVDPVAAHNPVARAFMNLSHAHREAWVNEDPYAGLAFAEAARDSFLEANHTRGALLSQVFIGMNAWLLGQSARAESELRATRSVGQNLGPSSSLRTLLFIEVLCERGALDEAEQEARALSALHQSADFARGRGLIGLGQVLLHRGELAAAESELRTALEVVSEAPFDSAAARTLLSRVQLKTGRAIEALADAEAAMAGLEALGTFGFRGMAACLTYAEALSAVGNHVTARQILAEAHGRLLEQAAHIQDPTLQKSFLESVPTHRRLIELAEAP